ncbi:MAG: cytochrome c [Burkholderiaceae bacterium]|jgi:cytochrome c556|nr:cytochrome c [Burkholderiaceae bacterium]
MKKNIASIALTLAACAAALPAHAQFAKPEDAVKYRQAVFTVTARHFGALGGMANGKVPFDAAAAAANADVLAAVHKLPWGAFGENTSGAKSNAKASVWKEAAKFKQGADEMDATVAKLVVAAKSGNLDNLKAAFGPAAKTCKSCHDQFKE